MRVIDKLLISLTLTVSLAPSAFGATIAGSVTGPDGKPFMGAFVVAENSQTKMTVNVLSNAQGRYQINNLPAATYTVKIQSIGYTGDPRTGVQLGKDQKASFDFALQKTKVKWSDLSTYQGRRLLPKTEKHDLSHKDEFFVTCFQSCHSFQKRMASQHLGRKRLASAGHLHARRDDGGPSITDGNVEDFTPTSPWHSAPIRRSQPRPRTCPQYKSLVRPFSPNAMNIAYVEYDFVAPNGMGPVERGRGQARDALDSVLRARQRGGAAQSRHRRADVVPARIRAKGRHPFGCAGA